MRILILICALALTLLAGCVAGQSTAAENTDCTFTGQEWVAESILGSPVIDRSHSAIRFADDGTVSGNGGCNVFSGKYTEKDGVITFGPLAVTRRACIPGLDDQERRFLSSLGQPLTVECRNRLLVLKAEDGTESVFAVQNK